MCLVVIAVAVVDLYTEDILLYILEVCSQPSWLSKGISVVSYP